MFQPLLDTLNASRYESADPATRAEVERNAQIAALHRIAAAGNARAVSARVVPLKRAGG